MQVGAGRIITNQGKSITNRGRSGLLLQIGIE